MLTSAICLHSYADVNSLRKSFNDNGFAFFERLISPVDASILEESHRQYLGRRVNVEYYESATWTEHCFEKLPNAFAVIAQLPQFTDLMSQVSGISAFDDQRTQFWINRYMPYEYVPVHRDGIGDVQLVLCLQQVPHSDVGGDLMLGDSKVHLRTGDAVLFLATKVPHGTTPFQQATVGPSGFSRVTAVIRLFQKLQVS